MIAIKTTSSNINSLTVVVDRLRLQEITDTISGDNTILSIFDTDENRKRIRQYIRKGSIDFIKKEGN